MPGTAKALHWLAESLSSCTHHLPAALMVTAVVTICHHKLHLLDAIDGYAFLGISNLTAHSISRQAGNSPTVAVVLIDEQSNEEFYRQRSPLDRCELTKDLTDIYSRDPKLLVVDLDLSPVMLDQRPYAADSAINAALKDCDQQLLTLLTQPRDKTETVLIAPFEMRDDTATASIETWLGQLKGFVSFAEDPTLSIRYGLVNDLECDPKSLAATAFAKYPRSADQPETCLDEIQHGHKEAKLTINPGHYFSGLRAVSVSDLPSRRAIQGWRNPMPQALSEALALPVVFVGTSFGDSDTFLTPLGTMYGVEVHAAAFMSLLQPTTESELLAFFIDMLIGLAMGGVLGGAWQVYFNRRFSDNPYDRQSAPFMILLLIIYVIVVVGGLTVVSYCALLLRNLWLSPIPIAVGMLFESFFNSAVGAAVGEGYEQRQALIRRLQAAHADGPERFASQVALEASQRPRHAHALRERAQRFFYRDYQRLREGGHHGAGRLLLIRRLVFFLLLSWLLWGLLIGPLWTQLTKQ